MIVGHISKVEAICQQASDAAANQQFEAADRLLAEAEAVASKAKDTIPLVTLLRARGFVERQRGNLKDAAKCYERTVEVLVKLKPFELAARDFLLFAARHALYRSYRDAGLADQSERVLEELSGQVSRAMHESHEEGIQMALPLAHVTAESDPERAQHLLLGYLTSLPTEAADARLHLISELCEIGPPRSSDDKIWRDVEQLAITVRGQMSLDCRVAFQKLALAAVRAAKTSLAIAICDRALAAKVDLSPLDERQLWFNLLMTRARALHHDRNPEALKEIDHAGAFAEKAFGVDDPWVVATLEQKAHWFMDDHKYAEAIPLLEASLGRKRKHVSTYDPQFASTANDLGQCLDQIGSYVEAVRRYRQAASARSFSLGGLHRDTLVSEANLAEMKRILGDFKGAATAFQQVLAKEQMARGDDTSLSVFLHNNLGEALLELGNLKAGVEHLERAYQLRVTRFGANSQESFRSLAPLIAGLHAIGDEQHVSSLMEQHVQYPSDPGREKMIRHLASNSEEVVAIAEGDTRWSERLAERVQKLTFGEQLRLRPHVLNLCEAAIAKSQFDQARQWLDWVINMEDILLSELLGSLESESGPVILGHARETLRLAGILALALNEHSKADLDRVVARLERYKGLPTRLHRLYRPFGSKFIATQWQNQSEEISGILLRLRSLRRELSCMQLAREFHHSAPDSDARLMRLRERIAEVEHELARRIPEAVRDWAVMGERGSADREELILEFIRMASSRPSCNVSSAERYRRLAEIRDSERHDCDHYYVVASTDANVELHDLGPAHDIDLAVKDLRHAITDPVEDTRGQTWREDARFLYNRLVMPIEHLLREVRQVRICPDGDLSLLPFDVLLDANGTMLADRVEVSYLGSRQELGGSSTAIRIDSPPLTIASPAFNGDVEFTPNDRQPFKFESLDGTKDEGHIVHEIIGGDLIQGMDATVRVFDHLTRPEIVHIATHAFVIPRSSHKEEQALPLTFKQRSILDDPMERCGLALCGADRSVHAPGYSPVSFSGLIYGFELQQLDLSATDLVTISACDSATGDIVVGDGAQGLRRAFKAAGARTVVCTLWKIPDQTTAMLMRRFYSELVAGKSRASALWSAKSEVRQAHKGDPFYWASFILDGEEGPLRRHHPVSKLNIQMISMKDTAEGEGDDAVDVPLLEARYEDAAELARSGDLEEALSALDQLIAERRLPPDLRAMAQYERAGILRKRGELDAAIGIYKQLENMEYAPRRIMIASQVDRALSYMLAGRPSDALVCYTTALESKELDPADLPRVLVDRGVARAQSGDVEGALTDWGLVIGSTSVEEQRVKAALNRADSLSKLDRHEEALADLELVVRACGPDGVLAAGFEEQRATAHSMKARHFLVGGEQTRAIASANAALDLTSSPVLRAFCLLLRSMANDALGQRKQAIADARDVLTLESSATTWISDDGTFIADWQGIFDSAREIVSEAAVHR